MQSLNFNSFKTSAYNQVSSKQTSAPSFRGAIGDKVVTQIVKGEKVPVNDVMAMLKEGSEISAKKAKDLIESLVGKLTELAENNLAKEEQVLNTVIERYNSLLRDPDVISKAFVPRNDKNVVVVFDKMTPQYRKGYYKVNTRVYKKEDFIRPDCIENVKPVSSRYIESCPNGSYTISLRRPDGQHRISEFKVVKDKQGGVFTEKNLCLDGVGSYSCETNANGKIDFESVSVRGNSFLNSDRKKSKGFEDAKKEFFEHF